MTACDTVATEVKSVNWAELRALHVKGVSLNDLSKRFGISYSAIRNKSSRERWRDTVAKAGDMVTQAATDDLQASVRSWIAKIDKFGHQTIDSIIKRNPDELSTKQLQELVSAAKSLSDLTRPNYGLDRHDATKTTVSIHVAANAKPHLTGSIIDVEQLPGDGQPSGDLGQKQLGGGGAAE
jgi:transposase